MVWGIEISRTILHVVVVALCFSAIIQVMIALLNYLQRKLRPELSNRSMPMRYLMMSNVLGTIYSIPLNIVGMIWLAQETDWRQLIDNWLWCMGFVVAIVAFSQLRFYLVHVLQSGHMVGIDGDFAGMILWAGILSFGYAAIWLYLIWILVELCLSWRKSINRDMYWDCIRSASLNISSILIASLISMLVYADTGGQIPITGLTGESLIPALTAILCYAVVYFVVWLPFIVYVVWVQTSKFNLQNASRFFWFTAGTLELPFLFLPFGILASGLLIEHGLLVLGIYMIALLMVALLANQLSRSIAQNQRRDVQLMGLEKLGREILAAPTDMRSLPGLLKRHIPEMFQCRRADVWLAPETYLLKYPDAKDNYTPEIWNWLMTQTSPVGFLEKQNLPWENAPEQHFALIAAPIFDSQSGKAIGGLFIELLSLPQRWKKKTIREIFPAVQNLADQIAAALKQAEVYQETLNHQRVTQELRLAGEIQTSFLPIRSPEIDGWDIAASLEPARQTSGDFYDYFALEDDRLGILIADVADKGLGAALYMALGRTLLLTYAQEYPENPAAVLRMTNRRLLSDARASMFITAFYGVLEPKNGRLIYCNAGHNPPLLLAGGKTGRILELSPNGMALGIDSDATWIAVSRQIEPEDTLLLYTDGVVEANDPAGEFYGMATLREMVSAIANRPSQWIIRAIQEDVDAFQGGTPQADDITLMCIKRRE